MKYKGKKMKSHRVRELIMHKKRLDLWHNRNRVGKYQYVI